MEHAFGSERVDTLPGFSDTQACSGELRNLKANCRTVVEEEDTGEEISLFRSPFTTCEIEACPATPSPDREIFELSSSSDQTEEDGVVLDCQTPKECIFDPFASGPEELVLAPKKKMPKWALVPLQRQLNFELFDDSPEKVKDYDFEDDELVDFMCNSLLELIISNRLQEVAADKLPCQHVHSEDLRTPTSLPLLTGVTDTCPPAPTRPKIRLKAFTHGICRKLEFGNDLV